MDEEDDPFAGLTLDEEFVSAATRHEDAGEERIARLQRIAAEHRRLEAERAAEQAAAARVERKRRRASRRVGRSKLLGEHRVVTILFVLVLLGAAVWTRIPGGGESQVELGRGTDLLVDRVDDGGAPRPPAPDDASTDRLAQAVPVPVGNDPYEFLVEQEDGSGPVAYDPCRPIRWVTNDRTAPAGASRLVPDAIEVVAGVTGLTFVGEGDTDERLEADRAAYQPDRYGEQWAPVLIAWSDPDEEPELAGDIAGMAGSAALQRGSGDDGVYVTGTVVLDGPQMSDIVDGEGPDAARAVILHELAHLVGLDHVDDRSQLMYPEASHVTEFGEGDLEGLALLGQGRCFPDV